MFIDGEWTLDAAGELPHVNPATGEVHHRFAAAGPGNVDRAVEAGRRAFAAWRDASGEARRDLLRALARALRDDADELAWIGALEAGIPVAAPLAAAAAAWFDHYAGWADKIGAAVSGYLDLNGGAGTDFIVAEPVGVVAAILTWNAPLAFIGMTVAPALAAGCCVIVKAPEKAPYSSLRFAHLCEQVGVPAGVVQVLPGGPDAGAALAGHAGVDKVAFTGGTSTARQVLAACAAELIPSSMELGGKSANIVFADADLNRAMLTAARFVFNSGQGCSLPTRLLVEDQAYDSVVGGVVDLLAHVQVGDPLAPSTQMGPVIDEAACSRILAMVERAVDRGEAKLLCGGHRLGGDLASGFYIGPTVLGDVDPASEIAQQEVFGPVLCATRFSDEREAVEIANSTRYGLAAYVQTADVARAHRLVRVLDAGSVHVNGTGPGPVSPATPFGGVKHSGFGRQGGVDGLREFLQSKNVLINL